VISQGVGLRATLARLHPKSLCHDEIEKRVVHYRAVYQREGWLRSYPFPDIQAVLERAARSNVSLGVVSNKSAELIHRALTRAELREYFQLIVGDGVTPHSKPDVRLFTDHIATLPSCPEVHEVLMIGDAAPDILFASSVGCISCWASYGYGDQKSCRGLEPDYTVHTPSELLQFVR
jgi:phosphoglycolate phosphatase